MASIGSYYITIMPDMSQFTGQIVNGLSKTGTSGGDSFSDSFIARIKSSAIGVAIGNVISQGISSAMSGLQGGIDRLDIITNFPKVMQNMGYSAEDAQGVIEHLSESLLGLPTALDEGVQAVQRLTASTGDMKKSTELFDAFNNALISGAAPMNLQSNAMEQFLQIVAKGKPDMLEWRTLMNAMPGQMNQIAESMGMSVGELGEAMRDKDGGYEMTQKFLEAVIKLNKEGTGQYASFAEQVGTVTHTIGTAQKNLSNRIAYAWEKILGAIGQEEIYNAIETLSLGIRDLGVRIGEFITEVKNSDAFQSFVDGLQATFGWLVDNSGVILPVLAGIVSGIKAFKVAVGAAKWFVNLAKAAQNFFGIIAGNPLTIVIAAVVALVAALAVWFATTEEGQAAWSSLCDAVSGAIEFVQGIFEEFVAFIQPLITGVTDLFTSVWNTICGAASVAFEFLQEVFNGFIPFIQPLIDAFGNLVTAALNVAGAIGDFIFPIIGTLMSALGTLWEGLLAPLLEWLIAAFFTPLGALVEAIGSTVVTVVSTIINIISVIVNFISSAISTVRAIVTAIVSFLADKFLGIKTDTTKTWQSICDGISKPIKDAGKAIEDVINNIKSWWNGLISNIKMPHLSVTGSLNPLDWFEQGLPKISISWYAKGGMFDGAALYGVGLGEQGPELAWPSYDPYLTKYGKAIADHMPSNGSTTVVNFYINGDRVTEQGLLDLLGEVLDEAGRYANMNLGGNRTGGAYAY